MLTQAVDRSFRLRDQLRESSKLFDKVGSIQFHGLRGPSAGYARHDSRPPESRCQGPQEPRSDGRVKDRSEDKKDEPSCEHLRIIPFIKFRTRKGVGNAWKHALVSYVR